MDYTAEPTLRDLIALIRRGAGVAFAVSVLAAATAFFVSHALPPTYEAQATLLVSAQDPNQREFGVTLVTAPTLDVATYMAAIRARQVRGEAFLTATGRTPTGLELEDFAEALTLRAEDARTSSVIRVLVRDDDAVLARDLANAVAAAAVRWDELRATRSLETIIDTLEAQIAAIDAELAATEGAPTDGLTLSRGELQLQLTSARALRTAAVGRVELLEEAEAPRAPASPRPLVNAALAGVLSIMLVYGIALLRDALDTRVRSSEDLVRSTAVPLLAEFPKVNVGRRGLPADAASYLRTAISFAASDANPKIILVTSTVPGHGKSSVSIALAESFARQHFRTLLIDADLRMPVLGREYGLFPKEHMSLRDALTSDVDAVTVCPLSADGVQVELIPSFEAAPAPTELLANRFRALLDRLKGDYDVIVIDSAPVLPVADALIIAPHVTGVVFAVSMTDADRRKITNAFALLRRVGVRVFGTVATNMRSDAARRTGTGYGYGYGYGVGYGTSEAALRSDDPTANRRETGTSN